MRIGKTIICIALLAALGGAWFNVINSLTTDNTQYNNYIAKADKSFSQGLYIQAVEEYKFAIAIKPSLELWQKVSEAYSTDYSLRRNSSIIPEYIKDMQVAASTIPKERSFWITLINLQKDNNRYADANKTAMQAIKTLGADDELQEIVNELRYKTELGYKVGADVAIPQTGYLTVKGSTSYAVINSRGETVRGDFEYIGPINKNGSGVYKTDRGFRLIDNNGVERAVFPDGVCLAGMYSTSDELVPLKVADKWHYFDLNGSAIGGSYDSASSFVNGLAAVSLQGRWLIIDAEGNTTKELTFNDLRFGSDGGFIQNGIIVAEVEGKWGLYDAEYEKIGAFTADNIDIYCGDAIAFKSGGKWGFVDPKGSVVIEPIYREAKSFSQGLAAIMSDDGLWGFINSDGKLVIPARYQDTKYFMDSGSCFVMTSDDCWQELRLVIR